MLLNGNLSLRHASGRDRVTYRSASGVARQVRSAQLQGYSARGGQVLPECGTPWSTRLDPEERRDVVNAFPSCCAGALRHGRAEAEEALNRGLAVAREQQCSNI